MDRFIEVEGTASQKEAIVQHRASLTLHVRSPDAQSALTQAATLRNECVQALLGGGLKKEELSEGGAEVWRTWWWQKKNVGQEANHRVLVTCPDAARMHQALAALEPLFENKRYTLDVTMMSPVFEATLDERPRCQRAAIADARAKAAIIAEATGVELGSVAQVEELAERRTRSGAYGDEDWGYPVAVAAGGAAAEPVELDAAQRSRSLRYRVRFSLRSE